MNIENLMEKIQNEFPEMDYDEKNHIIKGVINGKYQTFELSDRFLRKSKELLEIISKWSKGKKLKLINKKTYSEHQLSLLGILKILKSYQPNILHRFKGLGENSDEEIKETIMDPNTRSLIRVNIEDINNDLKVFQILRGTSQSDVQQRKEMMKDFKVDRSIIDT
jgi:DNA gyrase/topoisomerase IV subunit B